MQNGLQRLMHNAAPILVGLAIVIFLGNVLAASVTGAYIGYHGPQTFLRIASVIISSSFAPALLLGLAAIVDFLGANRGR